MITDKECDAHRRSNLKAEQITPIAGEEEVNERSSHYHESGVLFAEDVGQHMAVLPEVDVKQDEVTIDHIQVGDPGIPLTKDQKEYVS